MTHYISPYCSCMDNQNIKIGSDPVGGPCLNTAKYEDGVYFYCEEHYNKIRNGEIKNINQELKRC